MALPQPDKMSGVAPAHVRHKPEQTLLYQLVEQCWPEFQMQLSETDRFLPRHVTRKFEDYLACGQLENGLLRVRCESCSHERLVVFKGKKTTTDEEADGREEPAQTAAKRKGMCCTLKGIKAQRLKRVFNGAA